jgi:hypothetical protein
MSGNKAIQDDGAKERYYLDVETKELDGTDEGER